MAEDAIIVKILAQDDATAEIARLQAAMVALSAQQEVLNRKWGEWAAARSAAGRSIASQTAEFQQQIGVQIAAVRQLRTEIEELHSAEQRLRSTFTSGARRAMEGGERTDYGEQERFRLAAIRAESDALEAMRRREVSLAKDAFDQETAQFARQAVAEQARTAEILAAAAARQRFDESFSPRMNIRAHDAEVARQAAEAEIAARRAVEAEEVRFQEQLRASSALYQQRAARAAVSAGAATSIVPIMDRGAVVGWKQDVEEATQRLHGMGAAAHGAAGGIGALGFGFRELAVEMGEAFRGQRGQQISTLLAAIRRFSTMGVTGVALPLIGVGITASVVAHLSESFGTLAQKTQNAADAAGVGVQQYSSFQRLLQLLGADANKTERAFISLAEDIQHALDHPIGAQASAFAELLGPDWAQQVQAILKDPLSGIETLRQRFQALPADMDRTRMAQTALRGSFETFEPYLRSATQDLAKYKDWVDKSGAAIKDEEVPGLEQASLAARRLGLDFVGLGKAIAELAEGSGFLDFLESMTRGLTAVAEGAGRAREKVAGVATIIAAAGVGAAVGGLPGAAVGGTAALLGLLTAPTVPGAKAVPGAAGGAGAGGDAQLSYLADLVKKLENSAQGAVSPKGAISEYQLMPDTIRGLGADADKVKADSAYARQTAVKLLGQLNTQFKGDIEAILIAYNAGPKMAQAFLESGRHLSMLPQETQKYLVGAGFVPQPTMVQPAPRAPSPEAAAERPEYYREHPSGEGLLRELREQIALIREATQVGDAKYKQAIAGATAQHAAEATINALQQQQNNYQKGQEAEAARLYREYVERANAANIAAVVPQMQRAVGTTLTKERIDTETRAIEQRAAAEQKAFQEFAAGQGEQVQSAQGSLTRITAIYQEWADRAKAIFGGNSTEYKRVLREMERATQEAATEIARTQYEQVKADISQSAILAKIREDRAVIGGGVGIGQEPQARLAADAKEAAAIWTAAMQYVAARSKDMAPAGTPLESQTSDQRTAAREVQSVTEDALQHVRQAYDEAAKQVEESAKLVERAFAEVFSSIGSAFQSFQSGVMKALLFPDVTQIHAGLTTLYSTNRMQAIAQAFQSAMLHAINGIADAAENILSQVIAHTLGATAGQGLSDVLASKVAQLFPSLGSILGGAGGSAATASAMAPLFTALGTSIATGQTASTTALTAAIGASASAIVAAITTASVVEAATPKPLGFAGGGIVPSAAGGMVMGGGHLAIVHPQEMVLPRDLSLGVQSAIRGGGGLGGAGGSAAVTYSPTINTGRTSMSRGEMASLLSSHSTELVGTVRNMMRFGWRP